MVSASARTVTNSSEDFCCSIGTEVLVWWLWPAYFLLHNFNYLLLLTSLTLTIIDFVLTFTFIELNSVCLLYHTVQFRLSLLFINILSGTMDFLLYSLSLSVSFLFSSLLFKLEQSIRSTWYVTSNLETFFVAVLYFFFLFFLFLFLVHLLRASRIFSF